MVKITFETDDAKNEMSGKCVFAVVTDPEDSAKVTVALIGKTSTYELTDVIGKAIGAQIASIVPYLQARLQLIEIMVKAMTKGVSGELETKELDMNGRSTTDEKQ